MTELRSEPLAGLGAVAVAGACFLFFLLLVERERNSEEDAIFERDENKRKSLETRVEHHVFNQCLFRLLNTTHTPL